ncbi:hypothetical protein FHG87_002095, partial [Trinorchestia longiramus]
SLFTIGACGNEEIRSLKPNNRVWERALTKLEKIRKHGKDQSYVDALKIISQYLPQKFSLNFDLRANKSIGRISEANVNLPFVKCSERKYSSHDLKTCFSKWKDEA